MQAASVIFSDFGPGDTVSNGGGVIQGPSSPLGYFAEADSFTPGAEYLVTQLDFAFALYPGTTNSLNVTLAADNAGLPGASLETWNLTNIPLFQGDDGCCIETITPTSAVVLNGGERYWIEVTPGGDDTQFTWWFNNQSFGALLATDHGSGFVAADALFSAFDVQGNAVPEPSSLVLVFGGLSLLLRSARTRKKNYVKLTFSDSE